MSMDDGATPLEPAPGALRILTPSHVANIARRVLQTTRAGTCEEFAAQYAADAEALLRELAAQVPIVAALCAVAPTAPAVPSVAPNGER